jgi:cell division protease FtsH
VSDDDNDQKPDSGATPSVTAVPKTKPKKPKLDGGMEPEPTS